MCSGVGASLFTMHEVIAFTKSNSKQVKAHAFPSHPPPPTNEHTASNTGEKEGQSKSNPSPRTYQVTHTVQYNSFKVIDNV